MLFIKDNQVCLVEKDSRESYDMWMERGYFIVSNLDKENVETYARVMVNSKFFGMNYSEEVMEKLKEFKF